MNILTKIPISEINTIIDEFKDIYALVIDDKINQAIIDFALQKKIQLLVGIGYKEKVTTAGIKVITMKDLEKSI